MTYTALFAYSYRALARLGQWLLDQPIGLTEPPRVGAESGPLST